MNKLWNIGIGLMITGIAFYASQNLLLSIILGIVSIIAIWYYNPERRYWRAFWYVLVALITTNNFSIELLANYSNLDIDLKYEDNNVVSIILAILLVVLAILDFLQRNKSKFSTNKSKGNITTNVTGNGNITINGISNSTVTVNPNDSNEVSKFLKDFNDKLDSLPIEILEQLKAKQESDNTKGSKVDIDIGIVLPVYNPAQRKVTLKVSITNMNREQRFYNAPYFKLSDKVEFIKGASKQDTFLLFPISDIPTPLKLEYGERITIDFDVPPQQLEYYKQLDNGKDFIQVFVPTTLGELHSSNKLIITEFIKSYKDFMEADLK